MSSLPLFLLLLSSILPSFTTALNNLTVYEEPKHVRPYVIPNLQGYAVQAFGYVLRFPVTNVSTAGAISLLTLHGKKERSVPVHIHTRYHETFFVAKGAINMYINNQTRRMGPLDFGSVPPNTNHAFELLEPDTEVLGAVTPGGFSFYQQVGDLYKPTPLAPWPVDPLPPPTTERILNATGLRFDYNPTNYSLVHNLTNGTSDLTQPWHNGHNSLSGGLTPYHIAGGWGPKYLNRGLGQVIHLYMTGAESNGAMTVATLTMRAARGNVTSREWCSHTSAQLFRPLEGQLYIRMQGQTVALGTGDLAVVPAGTHFSIWSEVAFTKVYHVAAAIPGAPPTNETFGLVHDLLAESEPWDFAIFPDYY